MEIVLFLWKFTFIKILVCFVGVWVITRNKNITKNGERVVGVSEGDQAKAEAKAEKLIRNAKDKIVSKTTVKGSSTTWITRSKDDKIGSVVVKEWKDAKVKNKK